MPNPHDSILITGGAGMLAQALREEMNARQLRGTFVDRAACDITDDSSVTRAFEQHRPTLLINCAPHTKVDLCEEQKELADAINGHAVGRLARHARNHGTFLVHISTDFVFDGSSTRPYRPDDPTGPLSAYGKSKLLGEQLLQENAPRKWMIARTAWLYGRGGPSFPRTMIAAARAGKPLKVVSDQTGSPTYTRDLARALFNLVDRDGHGIYHLTNIGQTTWFDFTHAILEEFNLKTELSPTTSAEWFKIRPNSATRPAYSVLDNARYADLVGKPMRTWRDALRDYHAAVDAHGL